MSRQRRGHRSKLLTIDWRKYRGKWLALLGRRVVAVGATLDEVLDRALELYPRSEPVLLFAPKILGGIPGGLHSR